MIDKRIKVFGGPFESGVYDQMNLAMSIPVAEKGALMPDAHSGYSVPIGGVVALKNALSPAFVGYDIACRMRLSLLDISPEDAMENREMLAHCILESTSFGVGSQAKNAVDHEVMDSPIWGDLPDDLTKVIKPLARAQLGSSGGGK